jgi:GNAT superfamily N-acetyltransferase
VIAIRAREPADEEEVAAFLRANHAERVARLGQLLRPLDHPAVIAQDGERLAGVLTYVLGDRECEILTLHTAAQWRGVGTALIEAAERIARDAGCARLWVLTTNDNVDALRFYQRRGFRLVALNAGAVDRSRTRLKPEIPELGAYGIAIRDELVLERRLEG